MLVGKIDVSDKEMNRDVKTEPKVFRQMFGCHSGERGIEHVLGHTPRPRKMGPPRWVLTCVGLECMASLGDRGEEESCRHYSSPDYVT